RKPTGRKRSAPLRFATVWRRMALHWTPAVRSPMTALTSARLAFSHAPAAKYDSIAGKQMANLRGDRTPHPGKPRLPGSPAVAAGSASRPFPPPRPAAHPALWTDHRSPARPFNLQSPADPAVRPKQPFFIL